MNYDFKKTWNTKARAKDINNTNTFQYCILRAMAANYGTDLETGEMDLEKKQFLADYFLQRAYRAISNENKLNHCKFSPYQAASKAQHDCDFLLKFPKYMEHDSMLHSLVTNEDKATFRHLAENVILDADRRLEKKHQEYYSYVIVRQDIKPEQQAVQAIHAFGKMTHELALNDNQGYPVDHLNLVWIGVPNEDAVKGMAEYFYSWGHDTSEFRESDIGNQVTAIASYPIQYGKRKFMSRYKTLKFKNTVL